MNLHGWVKRTQACSPALPVPGNSCVTTQGPRWKTRLFHSWNFPNHILFLDGNIKKWSRQQKAAFPKVHLIKELFQAVKLEAGGN